MLQFLDPCDTGKDPHAWLLGVLLTFLCFCYQDMLAYRLGLTVFLFVSSYGRVCEKVALFPLI